MPRPEYENDEYFEEKCLYCRVSGKRSAENLLGI
jgi:hypothetical protein